MTENELVAMFEQSQEIYTKSKNKEYLKNNSQFFTPTYIVNDMLRTINLDYLLNLEKIKILEPAAGCGILILHTILYLLKNTQIKQINIDIYETDISLYSILKSNINMLKKYTKDTSGVTIKAKIYNRNFILANSNKWSNSKNRSLYNLIISNPPFGKINHSSLEAVELANVIYGQPNIYTLFIALSLKLLDKNGMYVVVSPRSYLVGDYAKNLRKFIFKNSSLTNIHTFDKRTIFKCVNQEIIISAFIKNTEETNIKISHNGKFSLNTRIDNIIFDKDTFSILVPKNKNNFKLLSKISSFSNKLGDIGLKVSVGPVVQFRNENLLSKDIYSVSYAPLLVGVDIKSNNKLNYFERKNHRVTHNKSININSKQLIRNSNYLILRKITAKDDKDTITSAVLEKDYFNHELLGLDNNLLYFHKLDKSLDLTREECYGLYCYINSNQFSELFSLITGTHAINVSDFRNIRFPYLQQIVEIGKKILSLNKFDKETCTNIIASYLVVQK